MTSPRRRIDLERHGLALILVLAALAWLPTVAGGFVWDDHPLVEHNPLLASPVDLLALLRADLWTAARGEGSGYHRPLALLSFLVDRQLGAGSPAFAHLHSVLWHLGAVAAVHGLLRLRLAAAPALAGSLLFALHPAQTEAIAWISARNDLMAVALGALGTTLLLKRRLAAGTLVLLLGLLSKEAALAWVALVALWAWRDERRLLDARVIAAGLAALAWLGLRLASEVVPLPTEPQDAWASRAVDALATWCRVLLLPVPLDSSRHLDYLALGPIDRLLPPALVLGLCGFLLARGRGLAALGLGFAALSLAPALLVSTTTQDLVSERYLYQPLAGLALAVAAALPARPGRPVVAAGLGAVLCSLVLVQLRLPAWRSDVALFGTDHARAGSPYAAAQLGAALLGAGDLAGGRAMLFEALEATPPICQAAHDLLEVDVPGTELDRLAASIDRVQASGCDGQDPVLRSWLTLGLARIGRWEQARAAGLSVQGLPEHGAWRPGLAAATLVLEGPEAWARVGPLLAPGEDAAVRAVLQQGGHPELAQVVAGP